MTVKSSNRSILITMVLGALLIGCAANSPIGQAIEKDRVSNVASSDRGLATPTNAFDAALSANASDSVTEWNQHAVSLALLPASSLAPVQQTRVLAIVQASVHDAVNGITHKYATYLSPRPRPANASPEAAAIAAAHYALNHLFMSQADSLDALYRDSLARHQLSENDPGIEYGRTVAGALLAARVYDFSTQAQYDYSAPGAGMPGVWVSLNNGAALLPGWGDVTPFVLHSPSQFRPDGPLALDSEQYVEDYNEIKIVGALNSPTRTTEQTQIAQFWRGSPTAIWNPILRQVIATRDFDLSAKARAFALFYLAAADASIACWKAKYDYNFWRPQLAIRGGDIDGNDLTEVDADWQPLLPTPPHPEYPSGHTTNSAAMATILEFLFRDGPDVPIVVTLSGITRQWTTFEEAVDEVVDARVYSGIHFRTSDQAGVKLGRRIANFVSRHTLRPCRESRC